MKVCTKVHWLGIGHSDAPHVHEAGYVWYLHPGEQANWPRRKDAEIGSAEKAAVK